MQCIDQEVDGLDPHEWNDDPTDPVDQQVPLQQRPGTDRAIGDPFERERDQREMISALKMMAERMALCGEASPMMLSAWSCG